MTRATSPETLETRPMPVTRIVPDDRGEPVEQYAELDQGVLATPGVGDPSSVADQAARRQRFCSRRCSRLQENAERRRARGSRLPAVPRRQRGANYWRSAGGSNGDSS